MGVSMLLEIVAGSAPERVAVGSSSAGLTYGELLVRAHRLAALLGQRGAERLGLIDLNSEAVPLCLFGAGSAGVPFAPVNHRLTDSQLRAVLDRLAPALVVVGDGIAERVGEVGGITMIPRDDLLATVATDAGDDPAQLPMVDDDSIAVLLFTSGTTGEPKVAVLRHRHLTSYILESVDLLSADEDEAQLVSVPAHHIAGLSAVLSSTFAGRRIVYLPGFDAEGWLRTVDEQGVTQAMVVPTMLGRILDLLDQSGTDLDRLRLLSYGGGRMPLELIRRAMARLPHVSFVNAYGLTETSSTVAVLGPDDHVEAMTSDDPSVQLRLCSVGRPLPSVEVEIRDPLGNVLPAGERGEIYVRGAQVAGEYLGTTLLTDDGWFPTKDAGFLDDGGFLYLDGRLDDVIVRGAENLSPGEIEDVLLTHGAVAEAAVVGVPDPEWGEAVAAAVVLRPGHEDTSAEALQAFVRERLRSTKTPQRIRFLPELPHNETGKLLRRVLRDELAEA